MFQHNSLDGEKHRIVDSTQGFVPAILEVREPQNNKTVDQVGRQQYAVVQGTLVSRFLPSVNIGGRWPHDAVGDPWWEVVSHPPHGGIVADFNKTQGGAYPRVLNPQHQVVGYAEEGEEVLIARGTYHVTRKRDGKAIEAKSIPALRTLYYDVARAA